MRRLVSRSGLLLLVIAAHAGGQTVPTGDSTGLRAPAASSRPANDSLFRQARRLVGEGNGVAGRALVDSLLKAADSTTPAYGDALYWHGVVALTAAEAERDYRRVIVEYPLAYYKDDALLSLAELEQARGDRAGALQHLQRYVKEHGPGKERGIAALGAARLAFDQRDATLGCAMLGEARRSATAADVELRNQIDAYGSSRCAGYEAPTSVSTRTPASAPATGPITAPVSAQTNPSVSAPVNVPPTRTAAAPTSAPAVSTPAPKTPSPVNTAAARTPATTPAAPAPAAKPTRVAPESTAHPAGRFTVQLAAYETRRPAEQLVAKLATRGVKARVSGTSKPFRVRLGFYRSRQEAANEVAALKKRGMIGFVAEEAPMTEVKSP